MKPRRLAILTILIAAICVAGLVALLSGRPETAAEVSLTMRGIRTNGTGTLCMLVAATNRSNRPYGVAFATQSKSAEGWADPSLIPKSLFYAGNGDIRVKPRSEREFLVPLRVTGTPWRVVGICFEQIPPGTARYWSLRWTPPWSHRNYWKFLTTPEISSNPRSAVDGGIPLLWAFGRARPAATDSDC
jgi:hypothetical protein